MKRETWSVALACGLGALIGTFAALEIADRFQYGSYLWCIGALFGGIVAYITVDFRHFCTGVAAAYRNTIAWRPNRLYWRAWFAMWLGTSMMVATVATVLNAILISVSFLDHSARSATIQFTLSWTYFSYAILWPSISLTLGLIISFTTVGRNHHIKTDEAYEVGLRRIRKEGYQAALYLNPVGIIFLTLYGIVWTITHSPQLIVKAATFVAPIALVLAGFVARVFVTVHSSRCTLCFVDATLGAAIGYTYGNVILGTVAGIIFGLINHELVAVRWLKLAPK